MRDYPTLYLRHKLKLMNMRLSNITLRLKLKLMNMRLSNITLRHKLKLMNMRDNPTLHLDTN